MRARLLLLALLTPLLLFAQTPVTIQDNGPIGSRVDILILGDGYTSAQLPQFAADVNTTMSTFFAQDPWKSYRKFINVHRLDIASAQSGAGHATTVNNALGSAYNCQGIERLICVNNSKVLTAIQNVPAAQRDIVLILVNDVEYGGSGGQFAVASLNASAVEIALHEIGHSFALLADEYGGPPPPACDTSREPTQADATLQTNRALVKWGPWIAASTAIPTLGSVASTPGLYEGADYCDNGMYRPTYQSKMRALGFPYDQINTEQFVRQYYGLVSPIDASAPSAAVTMSQNQSQVFTITPPPLDNNTITATWTLDNSSNRVGTGLSFTLNGSTLGAGPHVLTATVHDATSLVRTDPNGVTTATRSWNVTVTAACIGLTLTNPTNAFSADGGSGSVAVTASCAWTASTTSSWITFTGASSGSANATVSFQVQPNTTGSPRNGMIAIGGQTFVVTQAATSCGVSLNLNTANYPGAGDTGALNVAAASGCAWTTMSPVPWITASVASGSGTQTINITVAMNTSTAARSATVAVGNQLYIVTQFGLAPSIGAVVNAASFLNTGVAPGMLVTLFGTDVGPGPLTGLAVDGTGKLATSVSNIQVTFDGFLAPIIYVSRLQTSVVVPYEVSGKTSTQVVVSINGVQSAAFAMPVKTSGAGIFAKDSTGSKQGAVLNQDSSANSAANAEARGRVLQIYATGEGQTNPGGVDGLIAGTVLTKPLLGVTATVGGVAASVGYAGSAPGIVEGVVQVNVTIPATAPTGVAVPLVIFVGGVASQSTITVAIK